MKDKINKETEVFYTTQKISERFFYNTLNDIHIRDIKNNWNEIYENLVNEWEHARYDDDSIKYNLVSLYRIKEYTLKISRGKNKIKNPMEKWWEFELVIKKFLDHISLLEWMEEYKLEHRIFDLSLNREYMDRMNQIEVLITQIKNFIKQNKLNIIKNKV